MSTDWGLHCKQCDLYSVGANHGQTLLREVISAWPHIKALIEIPTLRYVEVTLMAHQHLASDLFSFLQEHDGHPLELSSEYGDTEPIEENPPVSKHNGNLDDHDGRDGWHAAVELEDDHSVSGWGKTVYIYGGYSECESSSITLDPRQSLSLLSWLQQEKTTLEQLAGKVNE